MHPDQAGFVNNREGKDNVYKSPSLHIPGYKNTLLVLLGIITEKAFVGWSITREALLEYNIPLTF